MRKNLFFFFFFIKGDNFLNFRQWKKFTKKKKNLHMCFCWVSYSIQSDSIIFNERKDCLILFRDSNGAKKCNLLQMLIFLWWNSDACDVNQWDLYNSRADTDIKWSKYHSISPVICLSKMRL